MASKTRTTPARGKGPSSVTIRMYNVGFGDCFLMSFHYASGEKHVLIDYGSTSAPKSGSANYMMDVAKDIERACNGKLHIAVATHRHQDHISGFSTEGSGTGKLIAALKPDHVIQPWTEDPAAEPAALSATTDLQLNDKKKISQFLGSLEDMHNIAGAIAQQAKKGAIPASDKKRDQMTFLGENNIKNLSAVRNLMEMGRGGTAHYVNAGMTLNDLLPGVNITVLGPPTLKQTDSIRTERARDPNEFWQFRSFWASQNIGQRSTAIKKTSSASLFSNVSSHPRTARTASVRWFIEQSRKITSEQTLELVRDLDSVLNNTSVILLFETGDRKLLFPGDAQIENWSYALNNKAWCNLLKDVNLYKVGHHGSLNATPKSLWKLFRHKGEEHAHDRLETLCSTKSGKHGSVSSGTEVPRSTLVTDLKAESDFSSTEEYHATDGVSRSVTLTIANLKKPLVARRGR
jgi:beta-lactamase superfamily II metal-dependent hydrolase